MLEDLEKGIKTIREFIILDDTITFVQKRAIESALGYYMALSVLDIQDEVFTERAPLIVSPIYVTILKYEKGKAQILMSRMGVSFSFPEVDLVGDGGLGEQTMNPNQVLPIYEKTGGR